MCHSSRWKQSQTSSAWCQSTFKQIITYQELSHQAFLLTDAEVIQWALIQVQESNQLQAGIVDYGHVSWLGKQTKDFEDIEMPDGDGGWLQVADRQEGLGKNATEFSRGRQCS